VKRLLVVTVVPLLACSPSEPATRRIDPTRPMIRAADAPRYEATLRDGVQFWKPGLPLFLADLAGVSAHEPWGRWTDGRVAVLTFAEPLPTRFTLVVTAAAYGPNVGRPATFIAGSTAQTATFATQLGSGPPEVRRLMFETSERVDRLEIRPYEPRRPDNGDDRALGLALFRLQVEPN
jgi:phosphoglycerol transferase